MINFPPIDIPADSILELFGQTFFDYCQDSGYDKILQVLGATPRDFLQVIFTKKGFDWAKKLHENFPRCPLKLDLGLQDDAARQRGVTEGK
jgi:hypothetical protein